MSKHWLSQFADVPALLAPSMREHFESAVMEIGPSGVIVHEIVEGLSRDELQQRTGAKLTFSPGCKVLTVPALAEVEA